MRENKRQRHVFRGFVGRIAKHHPLITRAAIIHTHGNVRRLLMDIDGNWGCMGKIVLPIIVA